MTTIAVIQWGSTGGGPLFGYHLAKALADESDVVVSFSINGDRSASFRDLGLPSFAMRTPTTGLGALAALPALFVSALLLRRFLRKHQVSTVIFAMEQIWQSAAMPLLRSRKWALMCGVHDAAMHPGDHNTVEKLSRDFGRRFADGFLVFSSSVREALHRMSYPPDRVWLTVHGAYEVDVPRAPVRNLGTQIPVVGFFGRLAEYKGIRLGYDAIAVLRERGHPVKFRVVGSGDASLTAGFDHVDDEVIVRWVADEDVIEVLRSFDVLLLPYTEASQSGVISYAMSLGLPTVATPVGGLREQAEQSGVAVVATSTSAHAIADAVAQLLADPQQRASMSEAGMLAARREYSWHRVASDVLKASTELARARTPHRHRTA